MVRISAVSICALAPGVAGADPTGLLQLPARPANAPTGSQFYATINGLPDAQREQLIVDQIATGNVPNFLRTLKPITVTATIGGQLRMATYFVTPDYLAIGSDADFFRMPMSAPLAQQIADICNCNLPTRKMVNSIYTNATAKLAPYPFSPATYDIDSVPVFWQHQQAVETQRAQNGAPLGSLIGGHKKDVVVTPQLTSRPPPPRVAIYGWHQLNGTPIQPLSLVHEATYEDYSHGIRLVESAMLVDNAAADVSAVLADAALAVLLSDEGAFAASAYPVPSPYPLPGGPGNLAANGGFEGGFTGGVGNGWTKWQAAGSNVVNAGSASANKYEGSYSQYFSRSDTAVFDGGVYQTVPVTSGATYAVSAWMKRQSAFAGTSMRFGVDKSGGTNGTAAGAVYGDLTGGGDEVWVQYTASVVATGPNLTLFARGGHTGTTGDTNSYFYVDAVTVTQTAPPPPVELTVNGSFESGFTSGVGNSWTKWQAAGSNTMTFGSAGVNKYDGSFSQYFSRGDTAVIDGGVYQRIAVTAGQPYRITAWMKRQSVMAGTSMKFGYDLTGGTSGASTNVVYADLTGAGDNLWVPYSATATATGGFITLFARGGHTGTTGGTNSYFYLDAVSLKRN